jgi:RNA polymerase sigma-70 factor (ECF subfamily)
MTTWLQTIVQNSAREWLRERRSYRLISMERDDESDGKPMDFADSRRTPEEHFEQSEMRQILMTEIGKLSSACSKAILLCAMEGSSQEEAAEALQVSVAAIKARVFSARRSLREGFQKRGIAFEN